MLFGLPPYAAGWVSTAIGFLVMLVVLAAVMHWLRR
jgi:hypothetical protein